MRFNTLQNVFSSLVSRVILKIARTMKSYVLNIFMLSAFLLLSSQTYSQGHPQSSAPQQVSPQEQELLAQLNDLALPEKIGLWPLAPGIWITLVLFIVIVASALFLVIHNIKRQAYRRAASKKQHKIVKHYKLEKSSLQQSNEDEHRIQMNKLYQDTVRELLNLLKQTYFTAYPTKRDSVAGHYGTEFISKLRNMLTDQHRQQAWSKVHIDSDYLYKPASTLSNVKVFENMISQLDSFSQNWISYHVHQDKLHKLATLKTGGKDVSV